MPTDIKLFPTKFSGYYVSQEGKVYRDPIKRDHTDKPVEVLEWLRGGARTRQYSSVNISIKENGKFIKQIKYYTHRLIAETLIPNPQNLTEVNHIDEDKLNNSVDNLEWISHKDNFYYTTIKRDESGKWMKKECH